MEMIYYKSIIKIKKRQVTYIAPLQPSTLAVFLLWGIRQELVVQDLPVQK